MKSVPYNSKPTIIEKFETAIAQLFGSKAARFVRLGVCAAEERRHYISTLSAVYTQHTVDLMA